jgi:hypothetical protein
MLVGKVAVTLPPIPLTAGAPVPGIQAQLVGEPVHVAVSVTSVGVTEMTAVGLADSVHEGGDGGGVADTVTDVLAEPGPPRLVAVTE